MELLAQFGNDEIAKVYVLKLRGGGLRYSVECVESVQPPRPRSDKWVLLVSTLFGCPVKCPMCDAGGSYYGKLSSEEIISQIRFLIRTRFGIEQIPAEVPVKTVKIQFARMGEPSFNPAVLDVLERLPSLITSSCIMPSVSTIAPQASAEFFEHLPRIKDHLYSNGNFQLQFSIHTTDMAARDTLIPVKKWSFERIAEYGERWFRKGDRKITLNFAASTRYPIEPAILKRYFNPEIFFIKITPLNPTENAFKNRLESLVKPHITESYSSLVKEFEDCGYEVLVSIGALEENSIGSNCGQYLTCVKEAYLAHRNYNSILSSTFHLADCSST